MCGLRLCLTVSLLSVYFCPTVSHSACASSSLTPLISLAVVAAKSFAAEMRIAKVALPLPQPLLPAAAVAEAAMQIVE